MTEPISDGEAAIIDLSRRLARKLVGKLTAQGIEPADATLGLAYALHDAASDLTGGAIPAVEWIRTFADIAERSAMEPRRAH